MIVKLAESFVMLVAPAVAAAEGVLIVRLADERKAVVAGSVARDDFREEGPEDRAVPEHVTAAYATFS